MRNCSIVNVSVALAVFFAGPITAQINLSQSFDESTITPFNTLVCEAGGLHASYSYYRSFNLGSFGIRGDHLVGSICIGIEVANENITGSGRGRDDGFVPLTINFYWTTPITEITHSAGGSSGVDASFDVLIPGDGSVDLSVIELPIIDLGGVQGVVVPFTATDLVVEIFLPGSDGPSPNDDSLILGSNSAGQSAFSFFAAEACDITSPTATDDLGFPNSHLVLVVKELVPGFHCPFLWGDINHSGVVNIADIAPFVNLVINGGYVCEADLNEDGSISLLDVSGFVEALTGG